MNRNNNQHGFAHIGIVLLVIIMIAGIAFAGWRVMESQSESTDTKNNESQAQESSKQQNKEADIELQNLGVDLSQVDISAQAVRDFESQGFKGFYIFGDKLSENRINPNFEYASLKSGAQVLSAIDGVVAFISEQPDSQDSEVFIQPTEGSMWTLGYDHLINLKVSKGDRVSAGDVIGEPALQNNGLTRFEIQINKDENGQTTHYCPTVLLAESVRTTLINQLIDMQEQWETVTGFDLYDIASQSPVGCLSETLTPEQAEGRQ